jgi:MraZ protein
VVISLALYARNFIRVRLREHAGITTHITFVGLGEKFQMWEPKRFESYQAEARQKVRDLRKLLGAGRRGSGGPEGARE